MLDQAERLRELAVKDKESKKYIDLKNLKPRIITVTSGKGGVGKSNFVVNTAIALQKMGKKVLIFDADMGMGNDDVLMGCLPNYNVFDVILGKKGLDQIIIEGPHGVKLLPGGTAVSRIEEIEEKQREAFIEKLSSLSDFDYIFMDTGAGINKTVLGFIACCEDLIVVTTPEPTSLTDAYSLVKAVSHFKIKNSAKIVVNRIIDSEEGKATFNKFSSVVRKFLDIDLQYLGSISDDINLVKAVRKQKPFVISYPNSSAAKDVSAIADKIIELETNKKGSSVQDLFIKIFNIFS